MTSGIAGLARPVVVVRSADKLGLLGAVGGAAGLEGGGRIVSLGLTEALGAALATETEADAGSSTACMSFSNAGEADGGEYGSADFALETCAAVAATGAAVAAAAAAAGTWEWAAV